ncbi:segregation/condensation protein A [Lachnospiraceae bacterium MD1]|jgi:segregation and condensation protein A|uniref:Segregation and condensation protein A n=1 Tax=Variimorphobacter saccharofermentans TaxID=2755051 RepID=A0A839K053_9FIRM|nr:segregation/condensation protein A [Variimorphobacter saccharofermentans]MBB2183054.1 segregation/condensation protein A [Variimorphobacter saccharofermentans]
MSIPVKLEAFEGPLDLLLHLIDKNKINIYDIPISEITEQYLDYIKQMESRNMEIMSEFLVMAATLINIKSKMLLPVEVDEEDEPIDPRQELVDRLLEYKMYKYISEELKDKQLDASRVMFKPPTIPQEIADFKEDINLEELLSDLTLSRLHEIFKSIVKKQVDKIDPIRSKFGKIEKEEINLSAKFIQIQEYGLLHKTFSFRNLLEAQHSKMEVIVTFLCILELMKLGRVQIEQECLFDDINITYLATDIIQMEGAEA